MVGVRSMLARAKRLEAARTMASPIQRAYGSLEAFDSEAQAGIDAGTLDGRDMPVILTAVRRWHADGLFSMWRRDRIWEYGR